MRPDEQHPTPAVAEARVGVEEVGSAVQSDDGLPRTRTAVDDEAPREDARMMASWSAWMVLSTSRMRASGSRTQAGDEGGLVVECGVPFQPLRLKTSSQ